MVYEFKKGYPTIESIKIKAIEKGYVREWTKPLIFDEKTISEYINCSNPSCQRGRFDIDIEIHGMVLKKETYREETLICGGEEGGLPKGKSRNCINRLNIEIKIKYKNSKS